MRKLTMALAALGLATAGLAVPATAAQADGVSIQAGGCEDDWTGSDGYVKAWDLKNCEGTLLGKAQGDDGHWGNGAGGFKNGDNKASSVMNSGIPGGEDVVAFYRLPNQTGGYGCLDVSEFYADDLSDNYYWPGRTVSMNNSISSHQWVYPSGCAAGSWIS